MDVVHETQHGHWHSHLLGQAPTGLLKFGIATRHHHQAQAVVFCAERGQHVLHGPHTKPARHQQHRGPLGQAQCGPRLRGCRGRGKDGVDRDARDGDALSLNALAL